MEITEQHQEIPEQLPTKCVLQNLDVCIKMKNQSKKKKKKVF